MLKVRVLVPVEIEIPETAEEWQLYTTEKGVRAAARELVAASVRALRSLRHAEEGTWSGAFRRAFATHVAPVMQRHAGLGASDTEPRNALFGAVERGLRRAIDAEL